MANFKEQLSRYPAVEDLARRAKKRLPHVAWEYLDMGTGSGAGVRRNRDGLDAINFLPRFMRGVQEQALTTTLMGHQYEAPFGIAPVGLTGLMWPRTEIILAQTAAKYRIPYTLSTVATQTPEAVGPHVGEMGWFQLYPPRKPEIRADVLKRAKDSGFHTLVITADVPAPSRRERATRAGLSMPPRITPQFVWSGITHPAWTIATLREGLPALRTVHKYAGTGSIKHVSSFVNQNFGGTLDWHYLKEVRDLWDGPFVIKGILHPDDAEEAIKVGVDGIQVSNHGARQLDGTPAAIDALPALVERINGRAAVIFDSGVRSGLDIIRALALGADFVMLGRPFIYGVSAFGNTGGDHTAEILTADLKSNMAQLGVQTIEEVKGLTPA